MTSSNNNPVAAYALFEDDHWWFAGRRQILHRMVRRLMEPSTSRLIVDVGCGPGGNIASFASMFRCLGVDSSEPAIELARRRFPGVAFVLGIAPRDIPEQAGEADLWLLMDVLEHVDDDLTMLTALVAAAKPGALFFITVPADPALWSPHDDAAGHRRRYTKTTLRNLWKSLPVKERMLSAYNARLYWPVKLIRSLTAWRGRGHGAAEAAGLDLRFPPAPFNGILTALLTNEAVRLTNALDSQAKGYGRGVSLVAVLERTSGNVEEHLTDVVPTSALTQGELGIPRR
jgi:SAM-dependent methyltransferase